MNDRPRQAVILAGGRGSRLGRLTEAKPKPMIEFHGKPFLHYLVELLRDQGFDQLLLLLGYLPGVIQDYFGNGSRFGVAMEYSVSPVEDETGRRLKLTASRLDPVFLLAYCDNYWPLTFNPMWHRFAQANASALVTVYQSHDATKCNMRIDDQGYVATYDKSRREPGLNCNDIGFLIVRKDVLDLVPDENVSFEQTVFPPLIAERRLIAWTTQHRYYSVGSEDRFAATEEFLLRRPTVLVDRDGVLNRRMGRAEYVCSVKDWQWLPGSLEALKCLHEGGFRVIVITNQPGIARGALTEATLAEIHSRMQADAEKAGGHITAVYHCPHGWNDGCACRKPKPGLLFKAQHDFHLDLSRTYFVGDDERDREAANAAACKSALVSDGHEFLAVAKKLTRGML